MKALIMQTRIHVALVLVLMMSMALPAWAAKDSPAYDGDGPTLSLGQAHKMALAHNYNIKNLQETIRQADILIWQAWSILLPNLSMNGSVTRNEKELAMMTPDLSDPAALTAMLSGSGDSLPMTKIVMQEKWGKSFGFTANMALFNARSIPLLRNAYANVDLTNFNARYQKNELLFAVTAAYYNVQTMKEMIFVAEENLKNASEFHKLSEARLRVGQGTRIDLLRAEIERTNADKELKNAKDSLTLAKTSLAFLIGQKGPYSIEEPVKAKAVSGNLDDISQKAVKDRLDLKASRLSVEMAERDKLETWMKYIPTFNVTYNWTWNSAAGFSGEKDSWALIFGASWSIFEGGMREAELCERASKIRQARNSARQMGLDVREDVETALLELDKGERNVELAAKQLDLAQESYDLVHRQYENGLASSLDLLDAQTALNNAKTGKVLEELQRQLAVLTLNKAAGEINPLVSGGER